MQRIKTITSYTALAVFLREASDAPLGYLARAQVADIPSPYAYSPSCSILDWEGRAVVIFETAHKRWEVYEVPPAMHRFKTDEAATAHHLHMLESQGRARA